MPRAITAAATLLSTSALFAQVPATLPNLVSTDLSNLVTTYKQIHAHPELSHHEQATAALVAAELRKSGYTVMDHIGRYPDGSTAFGVVGILENGPGPRLLIRADMDALPIVEETGLPYASHVTTTNAAGQQVGVMHACGHDVHVTTLIGTARALAQLRSQWHGTVMLVGQPSEETIDGAKAMLADNLFTRFPRPDLALALHDTNHYPAGTVAVTSGPALASSTSVDVTLRGIGGHGSAPNVTVDPIVEAAEFITQLQTIVSRQENPQDPAVVTVGTIHGGTKRNIIPNDVKLELTCRAFSEPARQIILSGIRRTAQAAALAANAPADRNPIVTVLEDESTPVTVNDPALAARVQAALTSALGAENVFSSKPIMGSEDFPIFGLTQPRIPSVIFWLGAMDPQKFAAAQAQGKLLPGTHTSRFEPLPEPTLRTGVTAMTAAAIALLQPTR